MGHPYKNSPVNAYTASSGGTVARYIVLVPMPKLDTSTKAIIAQRSSAMPKMPNSSSHGTTVSAVCFFRRFVKRCINRNSTAHSTQTVSTTLYTAVHACITANTAFW